MRNKLFSAILLMAVLAAMFMGCGTVPSGGGDSGSNRSFTDSAGRRVTLPASMERIAPSGSLAQIVLFSLCPDRLIGWSAEPSDILLEYLDDQYEELPVFGQFYGKNVNLNMEALIAARPDVIIDIGEAKQTIAQDMDALSEQTGIPVIFVEATLDTMADAYRTLGELLAMTEQARELSEYCAAVINEADRLSAAIADDERIRVYYAEGSDGLATDPSGSIHADIIDRVGAVNAADIDIGSGAGMTAISMEQLLLWQPEVILVAPGTIYDAMGGDPVWGQLPAVKAGRYYEIPNGPYNWMGRPPAVNRLLGIRWLGNLLYPDVFSCDMIEEAREFYRLFYHYELSEEQARALLANSTCK